MTDIAELLDSGAESGDLPEDPKLPAPAPKRAGEAPMPFISYSRANTRTRHQRFDQYLAAAREMLQERNIDFDLSSDPAVDASQKAVLMNHMASIAVDMGAGGAGHESDWLVHLVDDIYDEVIGLGPIAPAWRDPDVSEIMVNGWNEVYVEKRGTIYRTDVSFRSPEHAITVAKRLAEVVSDRAITKATPLVNAVLPGSRVAIAFGSIVDGELAISIRKFGKLLSFDDLIKGGSLDLHMMDFLRDAVAARTNIIVSGGTGSGKTTLINNLSAFIDEGERVLTIEDTFELNLLNSHVVALQSRAKASADDQVDITIADLLKHSLRMRPDRIIVGEVRASDAAQTLLEAANTGHDGTMTTLHANSAELATDRLGDLFRRASGAPDDVAKAEVASAFELVVHVTRRRGRRFVTEISEIVGVDRGESRFILNRIFEGDLEINGDWSDTVFRRVNPLHPDSRVRHKMEEAGIDPSRWDRPIEPEQP